MQTHWINFAKTGNPKGAGLPNWAQFDPEKRAYIGFTRDKGIVLNTGLRRQICDLYMENWLQHMKALKEAASER